MCTNLCQLHLICKQLVYIMNGLKISFSSIISKHKLHLFPYSTLAYASIIILYSRLMHCQRYRCIHFYSFLFTVLELLINFPATFYLDCVVSFMSPQLVVTATFVLETGTLSICCIQILVL